MTLLPPRYPSIQLRQSVQAVANPAGGLIATFHQVPPRRWWTGTVLVLNAPTGSVFAASIGLSATYLPDLLLGTWGESSPFGPVQGKSQETLVVIGAGLTAGTTYTVSWVGFECDEWTVVPEWPEASSNPGGVPALPGSFMVGGGGFAQFTVPTGVTSLVVDMAGGAGSPGQSRFGGGAGPAGLGGRVQCGIPVVGGQVLDVFGGAAGTSTAGGSPGGGAVGQGAPGQPNGGGGGGESVIVDAATSTVLVAAGAGGGGGGGTSFGAGGAGGAGGGTTAAAGSAGAGGGAGLGGGAGTPSTGGTGGTAGSGGTNGAAGASQAGGAGGNGQGVSGCGAGGGGSGQFGGGGGGGAGPGSVGAGGGGGGSSFTEAGATAVTHTQGYQSGSGYCILYWA